MPNLGRQRKGFAEELEKCPAPLMVTAWCLGDGLSHVPHTHCGYQKEKWERGFRYRSPDDSKRHPGECSPSSQTLSALTEGNMS